MIGRKGVNIQGIRELTGAFIDIREPPLLPATATASSRGQADDRDRTITLGGTKTQVAQAQDLAYKCMLGGGIPDPYHWEPSQQLEPEQEQQRMEME